MHIMQSRRDFLGSVSAASTAAVLGGRGSLADEGPPETTTIRLTSHLHLRRTGWYVAEDVAAYRRLHRRSLRAKRKAVCSAPEMVASGEVDFDARFGGSVVYQLAGGQPVTALAGVHSGCYELIAQESIRTVSDLKGRRVGIQTLASSAHLYLSIMATYIGLDAQRRHRVDRAARWQGDGAVRRAQDGRLPRHCAEAQELRERELRQDDRAGRSSDRPWSQYFCCMLVAKSDYVERYPIATKRFIRALLKGIDVCVSDPEMGRVR